MGNASTAEQSRLSSSTATKRNRPGNGESESDEDDLQGIEDLLRPSKIRAVSPEHAALKSRLSDRETELHQLKLSLDLLSTQKAAAEQSLAAISTELEVIKNFPSKYHHVGQTEGWNEALKHANRAQGIIQAKEQTPSADIATQTILQTDQGQCQEHEALLRIVSDLGNERDELLKVKRMADHLQELHQENERVLQQEKDNHSLTRQDLEMRRRKLEKGQAELLKTKEAAARLEQLHQENEHVLQQEKDNHNLTRQDLETRRRELEKEQAELLKTKEAAARLEQLYQEHERALRQEKDNHSITKLDLETHHEEQERLHRTVLELETERDELLEARDVAAHLQELYREHKVALQQEKESHNLTRQDLETHRRELEREQAELLKAKEAAARLDRLHQEDDHALHQEKDDHSLTRRKLDAERQERITLVQTLEKEQADHKIAIANAIINSREESLQQTGIEYGHIIAEEKQARATAESALSAQAFQHRQAVDSLTKDLTDKVSRLEQEKIDLIQSRDLAFSNGKSTGRDEAFQEATQERNDMERTANSALQQERSARTAAESARDAQCTEIKSLAAKVRELEMEKENHQDGLAAVFADGEVQGRNASLQELNQKRKDWVAEAVKERNLAQRTIAEQFLEHQKILDQKNQKHQAQLDDINSQLKKMEEHHKKELDEWACAQESAFREALATRRAIIEREVEGRFLTRVTDLEEQLHSLKQNPQSEDPSHQDDDIEMVSHPAEKAKGKQPERLALPQLKVVKKQHLRVHIDQSSTGRMRDHEVEPIVPPMKFTKPYGASSSLSERLRFIAPAVNASRATTPARSERSVSRDPTPGPSRIGTARSHKTPLRHNPSSRRDSCTRPSQQSACSSNPTDTPPPLDPKPTNPLPPPLANPPCPATALDPPPESFFVNALKDIVTEMRDIGQNIKSAVEKQTPVRSRAKPHGEFKVPSRTKPRTVARTGMMNTVRLEMNELLGIKHDGEIAEVVEATLVSHKEVEDYLNNSIDAPALQPLRIFWDQVNHPWNGHLASLFVEHFINENPEFVDDQAQVEAHFTQRLKTLRRILIAYTPRTNEQTAEEASQRVVDRSQATRHDNRIRKRKKDLSDSRLRICESGASAPGDNAQAWNALLDLVSLLGVDGTSSDESDGEAHSVRFQEWRSAEVRKLLIYIDNNRTAVNAYGNPLPGARSRKRIRGTHPPPSKHLAVASLPLNFYDKAWYDTLTERQQVDLDAAASVLLPELT